MINEDSMHYGPLRCTASQKPRVETEEPCFYRCKSCGGVLIGKTGVSTSCHGKAMERLQPQTAEDSLNDGKSLTYDIVGGLNENCVRVFWEGERPDWLCLRTYTGEQYMKISAKKHPPAVFALAGDDAYAYCDKNPCEKCSFRCKNGFVLYAYYCEYGLLRVELNQIASTQGSLDYRTRMQQRNQ